MHNLPEAIFKVISFVSITFLLSFCKDQAQKMLLKGIKFENLCLGDKRPTALIRKFGNLYAQARVDTLDALDSLPQLQDADELKSKLLLSVVVVS